METDENIPDFISILSSVDPSPPKQRDKCVKCRRPMKVCWCAALPVEPIHIRSHIFILQHPSEVKRPLRTVNILNQCLEAGSCQVIKGRRFNLKRYHELSAIVDSPKTCVLFPGPQALDIEEFCDRFRTTSLDSNINASADHPGTETENYCGILSGGFNLVFLDGTWSQASTMYKENLWLHQLQQVKLTPSTISVYVIRTQPSNYHLSTLECAARVLAVTEQNPLLVQTLVKPLETLCSFQLDYGAVKHDSKEYLIENGLYEKQVNRGMTGESRKSRERRKFKENLNT